jgi:predicted HTH transcriptional regulator
LRDEYFKVISGFANAESGGNLIIGVNDDGNPVEMKNSKKMIEHIPNKARNNLRIIPSINCTTREKLKKVCIIITNTFRAFIGHNTQKL